MSEYYEPGTGDKDARDYIKMRAEDRLRGDIAHLEEVSAFDKPIGSFEQHTKVIDYKDQYTICGSVELHDRVFVLHGMAYCSYLIVFSYLIKCSYLSYHTVFFSHDMEFVICYMAYLSFNSTFVA